MFNDHVLLHIGGQCMISAVFRNNFNFYKQSLPFDYVRTKLSCIIKNINNNFENYVPDRNRSDFLLDTIKLFIDDDHAFYNHDITLNSIKDRFKRRCERFNDILINNNNLILVRVITSKNISDEINLKNDLYDCIKKKNKNINLKIVFICLRNDNNFLDIYYNKIDNNSCLFTCGYKFSLEEYCQVSYKSCIDFILKNGFIENKLLINLQTLEYEIKNEIPFNDINFYDLDNYLDIVPKDMINNKQIISNDEFYNLYPDFDINIFKMYNEDFKLFNDIEIINYFYLYGNTKKMIYRDNNKLLH